MADISYPVFGDVWASTGDRIAPPAEKISQGWTQEMMPFQYQNYLQGRVDSSIAYLLQKGVPEYNASQEYIANKSVVLYLGGLYVCTATGTGVLPTNTANWRKLTVSVGVDGTIPVSAGGTGAATATQARTNLGLGSWAVANVPTLNGIVAKKADGSFEARTISGTTNYVTVENGDGISGNPVINVGSRVAKLDQDAAWTTRTSIRIPVGATEEAGVGVVGRIRFDTTLNEYVGYKDGAWQPIGSVGINPVYNFSGNGVNTDFTLLVAPKSENNVDVFFSGVYQNKNTYMLSGNTVVFSEAPPAGVDNIEIRVQTSVPVGNTTAGNVSLIDSGNYYQSNNVEGALYEVGGKLKSTILHFATLVEASAAAATLPDGQEIEAPNSDGRLSRFEAQGGALAFKDYAPDVVSMQSYTELRAYTGKAQSVNITTSGIAGIFNLDYLDTVTSDNGGTVIVDASNRRWKRDYDGVALLDFFGAKFDGSDESSIAIQCLAATNAIFVQKGKRLVCKNVELASGSSVTIAGSVELPDNCSDFDRCFYGYDKPNIEISINEIDGNYDGQSGNIGTHLIYLVRCHDAKVHIKHAYDHYIASGAPTPPVDGIRNTSTGTIFLYQCDKSDVTVGLIDGWGREAIYLLDCTKSEVTLGHAQGKYVTEYSGVQVSGNGNSVNRASVDNAGASAVGFDTTKGVLSNVIATNTRENSGVNFGHIGFPATGSVASNIIVDGAFGYGISVGAGSNDVTISNFNVKNTGQIGISFSDGVLRGKLSDGVVAYPSQYSLGAYGAEVRTSNVRSIDRDSATLLVNVTSGKFVNGDTVSSVGGTAEIRKVLGNLTGSKQRLFFPSNTPASYSVGQTITGTNGAVGTIEGVYVPVEYYEGAGGRVVPDARTYESGASSQIRFSDGSAIYAASIPLVYTSAGGVQDFDHVFGANAVWEGSPRCVVTIANYDATSDFSVDYLTASFFSGQGKVGISFKASANQTYGVTLMCQGRWK